MANVNPHILQMRPTGRVDIHLSPDHIHGSSGPLILDVRCDIVPAMPVNVHLCLQLLDPALFLFADSHSSANYFYNNVTPGAVLSPVFRVINIAPLTGLPFRIRVLANDVNEPGNVNASFAQFPAAGNTIL